MTAPWNSTATEVDFTFRADGTYSGHAVTAGRTALGYGTDADSAEKKYAITDLRANGDGRGFIKVVFGVGNVTEGELDRVRVCAQGGRLDFAFFPAWLGHIGPLEYRLARQP